MHYLLEKLLLKKKLDIRELSAEETADFERWNGVLSKKELKVQDIVDFCVQQIADIEAKWQSLDNPTLKNERLIIMHTVYSKILQVTKAGEQERKQLEAYLQGLVDNTPS